MAQTRSIERTSRSGGLTALGVILTLTAGAAVADSGQQVVRLSDPVEVTATHETFGSALPDTGQALALATVLENGEQYLEQAVKVTARVSQVCQMKGCFFIAQDGDYTARVSFIDYSFFVPSDISGRTVTLLGELTLRDLSPQQAEHYNADMADSGELKPGQQYEIVATAVRVPKS